jgi:hypothetical protein
MMNKKEEIQKYLKSNVNHIIEQLMTEIVIERPKNIVAFCKKWFTEY